MMAVGCLAAGFTSCDDDDDDDVPAVATIAGDFYGVNVETMDQMPKPGYDSTSVSRVIAQSNGKFTVVLPTSTDQSEGNMAMPAISIKDVEFKAEGNNQVAAIAETKVNVMAGKDAVVKNFKAIVNPSSKTLDLTCSIQYGKMPFFVNNAFRTLSQNDFLVGEFGGDNHSKVGDSEMPAAYQIAKIEAQNNGKYTLVLPEAPKAKASFRGMEMPTVRIENVEIKAEANVYTFAIEEAEVPATGMVIGIKNLQGKVFGNKLNLSFSMKPGKMPMFVDNTFEGGKLAK